MDALRRPQIKMPSLKAPSLKLPSLKKGGAKDSALVGLEIEAGSIGAAEVRSNGATHLSTAATVPLAPGAFHDGEVTDPDSVAEALRELFAEHKLSKQVRLGIANQRVVVRTLRLPAIEDPSELAAAVRFSAQEQIAMPLDQAVIDHRVVGGVGAIDGAPPQVDVIVVAARRDMVAASLKPLKDAGLEPVGVDLSAFGMIRALGGGAGAPAATDAEQPPPSAVLYCNVGDVTNLAIAKGRSCLFTRISPVGLEDIAGNLASTTGLSPEHAQMWLDHVGLEQAAGADRGGPRHRWQGPRGARERRLGVARRAASLARLLWRPGGGRAGRAGCALRAWQRGPRPGRSHGAGARTTDRDRSPRGAQRPRPGRGRPPHPALRPRPGPLKCALST